MRHIPSRFLSIPAGTFPLTLFLAGTLLFFGCGKHSKAANESGSSISPPAALVVEQQISGVILGKTLKSPTALAVDRRGALYLIDAENKRVIWFDNRLTPLKDFSGEGSATGRLSEPTFLTVDADQTVWITDSGRRALVQCSDKLGYIAEIVPKEEDIPLETVDPAGIAVMDFGEIWVADTENNRIIVLDALGQLSHYVGDFGYAGGALRHPGKLLTVGRDKIYVCDSDNRRIVVYDDRGSLISEIDHPAMENPVAAAVDRHGRLWVLDKFSGRMHCFDRKGDYLASLGPMVSGTERMLSRPTDLAFALDGRLLISDTGNDRLLVCQILSGTKP